jgi:hypothetical protein
MASVMIGIDPHKASRTAVAIGGAEEALGELRIRASVVRAEPGSDIAMDPAVAIVAVAFASQGPPFAPAPVTR